MRSLAVLVLLWLAVSAGAQSTYVVVTEKEDGVPVSDGTSWNLELGEAFPLICWVSASEIKGGKPDPTDRRYALLQMDNLRIVATSSHLKVVEQKDLAAALMTYRQIVQETRKNRQSATAQKPAAERFLSDQERSKMLHALKSARAIRTIAEGALMGDAEIKSRYESVTQQQRLRQMESDIMMLRNQH